MNELEGLRKESINVDYFYELFRKIWWDTSSHIKLNKIKITYNEKKKREKRFDDLVDILINHLKSFPSENKEIFIWKNKLYEIINRFLEDGYIFDIDFNEELRESFFHVTRKFIREARIFDDKLKINDIGQAMRNVWIINIIQAIKLEEIKFSEAIFGYSMLYPYTDNYLDNVNIDIKDKINFNKRLLKRLNGEKICAENEYEGKVYSLLEYIEKEYNMENYPEVYESLIKIQIGQILSLDQQNNITIPYERDILGISIEKGGASVLVDGFIINGKLKTNEIKFCIGYGILLQLADDLQDVKEDIKNNNITIMSQLAGKYNLDSIANKLINFTIDIINNIKDNSNDALTKLIEDNCLMLIFFSIAFSKEFFSRSYIEEIENYLPFTLRYINNMKANLTKKFKTLKNLKNNEDFMMVLDKIISLD